MAPLRNQRHELFANLIVQAPRTGMSNTACYLASGYRAEGNGAEVNASKLLSSAKVQQRIAELTAPVVKKTRVTIQSLLAELETTIADARAAKQHSVVVQSLTLAAKLVGALTDRIEIGEPGEFSRCKTAEQVVEAMIDEMGSPAAALAAIDHMRGLIEERASGRALDVTAAREWPSMVERRRGLS